MNCELVLKLIQRCNKCEEILRRMVEGFAVNKTLDMELLLIISFYLIDESLENMMIKEVPNLNESTIVGNRR